MSDKPGRRPSKDDSLQRLKAMRVPVETLIDVGVQSGTPGLMEVYSDVRHILVEPIVEWNERIVSAYSDAKIDFEIVNVAASNFNGTMNIELSTVIPGLPISHARLTDKTDGENLRQVDVRTVDEVVALRDLAKPYLLKIDVDGVEQQILEGAKKTLPDCSVVIVEAQIHNFVERANSVMQAGFDLFDVVDLCYYDGRLLQMDLVFINRRTVAENGLEMFKAEFDISNWYEFR